jgi:hypothetical protein
VPAPIAQPVEQTPLKRKVLGSIPSGRTRCGAPCARRSATARVRVGEVFSRKLFLTTSTKITRTVADFCRLVRGVAEVAKLVDALVLGTSPVRGGGSSPLLGTIWKQK